MLGRRGQEREWSLKARQNRDTAGLGSLQEGTGLCPVFDFTPCPREGLLASLTSRQHVCAFVPFEASARGAVLQQPRGGGPACFKPCLRSCLAPMGSGLPQRRYCPVPKR